MHKESGYILSITPKNAIPYISNNVWFGPKVNLNVDWITAENFTSNGLKTFSDLESAQEAENELDIKLKPKSSEIIYIKLKMAENLDELNLFRNKKKLVVIQTIPEPMKKYKIFGRFEDNADRLGYIPGSFFLTNGNRHFRNYDNAEETLREINRQAQCAATIATLTIKKTQ